MNYQDIVLENLFVKHLCDNVLVSKIFLETYNAIIKSTVSKVSKRFK